MPRNLTLKLAASAQYDTARGCLRIVASAPVADRDDEVVDPRTIRLDAYRKNPVVIFVHDQQSWPIAKCETPDGRFTCEVTPSGELVQEWHFANTDQGRMAASLYRDRILRGASIGFLSDGLEDVPPDEAERMYGVRKRLKRHIGGELLETSAVPVPSCPGALALGWVDAPAAKRMLARRGVGVMVTKAFSGFSLSRQATPPVKMVSTRKTPRGTAVSTTATDTTTKPDVTTKDMTTLDDTAGGTLEGEPGHPHDNVKAGLAGAMHDAVDKFCAGEMDAEQMKAAIDEYAADHGKYSETGDAEETDEDTDVVEKDEDADDSDDDDDMKAVGELVKKAVAAAVAPLKAEIASLSADLDATLEALVAAK